MSRRGSRVRSKSARKASETAYQTESLEQAISGTHCKAPSGGLQGDSLQQAIGGTGAAGSNASNESLRTVLSGQQDMAEESKKRAKARRSSVSATNHPAAADQAAAHGVHGQDAFNAFAAKYRDVLQYADAEEAEAVYSMVALTHGKVPKWEEQIAEAPEGRPLKRQHVAPQPAASACSEGGSSDSSAKSVPAAGQQHAGVNSMFNGMMSGSMFMPPVLLSMQQQQCLPTSMPMAPGFFPGMMGMTMAPTGCPMPPFVPPWAVPPGIMPMVFGGMGMFGPMPPGSPSLMPLPVPGSVASMPPLPGALLSPGFAVSSDMVTAGQGQVEPAAGIPFSGPLPSAGHLSASVAAKPAQGLPTWPYFVHSQFVPQILNAAQQPRSQPGVQQQQPPKKGAVAAAAPGGLNSGVQNATASNEQAAGTPTAGAAGAITSPKGGIHKELRQFDVVALRSWVVSHFCEAVYLLLLDVWRPDSSKVRDALWAWQLHVQTPQSNGSEPDYRAFLVSLFGLEKLLQLTAADRRRAVQAVAPAAAASGRMRAATDVRQAAGSGDSSAINTTSRTVSPVDAAVVGSAASPHVQGPMLQAQPA